MPASSVPAPRRHRGRVSHSLSVLAVAAVVLAAPACSSDDHKDASPLQKDFVKMYVDKYKDYPH